MYKSKKEIEKELLERCYSYGITSAEKLEQIIDEYNNYANFFDTLQFLVENKHTIRRRAYEFTKNR